MRKLLLGILAACLVAGAASATPIITINGGIVGVLLTPGTSQSITIGIEPDANKVSGFNLIFEISNTAGVSLVSCSPAAGVQSSCPAGGMNFSFGAALSSDATQPFQVASFSVNVAAGVQAGTTITLLGSSTVTDSSFNDIFVGPITIAQVAPEPATAGLLALGLGGLALLGRKRIA